MLTVHIATGLTRMPGVWMAYQVCNAVPLQPRSIVLLQVSASLTNSIPSLLKKNSSTVKKMVGPLAPTRYQYGYGCSLHQVMLIACLSFLIGLAVAFYGRPVAEMFVESKPDILLRNMTHNSPLGSLTQLWTTK